LTTNGRHLHPFFNRTSTNVYRLSAWLKNCRCSNFTRGVQILISRMDHMGYGCETAPNSIFYR
jgi:hypothetical protein